MQIGPLEQATSVLSIIPIVFIAIAGVFVATSGVVVVLVILVVSNRAEPDSQGRRPLAVYFFGISFIATFVALFGTFAMVLGLVQLIGSHSSPASQIYPGFPSTQGGPIHPIGDAVTRVVVLSLIVVAVAVVLLVTHLRRALALPEWVDGTYGPVSRVAQSYIGAVTFVAVTIAASSTVFFAYDLCRAIAPGVFELSGPTVNVVRALIASFYLAAASGLVIFLHSRIPPGRPNFWWTFRRAPSGGPAGGGGTHVPGGPFGGGAQGPGPLPTRLPPPPPPPSSSPPFSAENPPPPQ